MTSNLPNLGITTEQVMSSELWSKDLLNFSPGLMNTPEWILSLKAEGIEPVFFNFYIDNLLIAKVCGLAVQMGFFGSRKLYFYSGPALKDNNTSYYEGCMHSLITYARKCGFCRIIFRSYDFPFLMQEPIKGLNISNRSEYILDLTIERETIFHNINKKAIKKYKKCVEAGYTYGKSQSPDLLDQLIELMGKTQEIRKNKGYTKYSYLYLQYLTRESLAKMMESGIGYIYYAEKDGSIQCMNFLILKDRKACGLLTGSTAEGYKIGLPSFLKYIVIDQLKEQEYLYLNLGGSPNKNHSGIAAFKLSLGCTEVWKSGFSTNYLLFPYKLINPVLMAGRMLPDNALFRKIKKMI